MLARRERALPHSHTWACLTWRRNVFGGPGSPSVSRFSFKPARPGDEVSTQNPPLRAWSPLVFPLGINRVHMRWELKTKQPDCALGRYVAGGLCRWRRDYRTTWGRIGYFVGPDGLWSSGPLGSRTLCGKGGVLTAAIPFWPGARSGRVRGIADGVRRSVVTSPLSGLLRSWFCFHCSGARWFAAFVNRWGAGPTRRRFRIAVVAWSPHGS